MRTLIRNAFVASVDPAIGDIDGCDILVEGRDIVAIRPEIAAGDAAVIAATGCIAIPGFVDTHRHLWEGGMRAVTADWSILDFSGNIRLFAAKFFRPQDMYATSLQGGLEALNAGVTTVAEYCHNVRTPDHAAENLRGVREAGLRTVWSYGFTGLAKDANGFGGIDERIAFLERFAAAGFASKDSMLTLGICPEEPFLWGADRTPARAQFDAARRLGARIFLHTNSRPGYDGAMMREVAKMRDLGVLGPDLVLVHMAFTEADEWRMLGDAGGHVSYTPETEYQMGLGWPSIAAPRSAGVTISVGTDITANNSADMFFQLRLLLQVERAVEIAKLEENFFSRTPFDCKEALHWGTLGGARALGLDHRIGSLAPGKAADIVLLRADDISTVGWDRSNPAATIIQQAGVHSVETVMVDGSVVKRHGKLVGDSARACKLLLTTAEHVHASAAANGGFGAPLEVLYERVGRKPASENRRCRLIRRKGNRMPQRKIHLVGSVPLADATEVFERTASILGCNATRFPDGETGQERRWISMQRHVAADHPQFRPASTRSNTPGIVYEHFELQPDVDPASVDFGPLGYVEPARTSYAEFARLRAAGITPQGARFLVAFPTPAAFLWCYVTPAQRASVEPAHLRRLKQEVDEIHQSIPHEGLAIQ